MQKAQLRQISFTLIFLAAALRIYTASHYLHIMFPDEQFQTLEPASWTIFGFGWKSWEWYHGVRSWFIPGLYMPVLGILKLLDISGGPISIIACRVLTAIASCASLWGFYRLLQLRKIQQEVALIILAAVALFPTLIVWNASTLSETWASSFFWFSLPLLIEARFIGGLFLGLSVVARIQMAPLALGFLFIFYVMKGFKGRSFKSVVWGLVVSFIFLGVLDAFTWGKPFYSVYKNIYMNIWEGVADMNGRSPWSYYFTLMSQDLGLLLPLACTASVVSGVAFLFKNGCPSSRDHLAKAMDVALLLSILLFITAHSLIGHKETRFIVPAYLSIFYALAWGINITFENLDSLRRNFNQLLKPAICIPVVLAVGVLTTSFAIDDSRFDSSDLSDLSVVIRDDADFRADPNPCLTFVNHYWIWTRGEMLFGRHIPYNQFRTEELTSTQLDKCPYVIAASAAVPTFRSLYEAKDWKLISINAYGHGYFKNTKGRHL